MKKRYIFASFILSAVVFLSLYGGASVVNSLQQFSLSLDDLWLDDTPMCCTSDEVLTEHHETLLGYIVSDIWRSGRPRPYTLPNRLSKPAQAVYVGLSANGQLLSESWVHDGTVLAALETGIQLAREELSDADQRRVDRIEIFLGHSFRQIEQDDFAAALKTDRHRGAKGLEISLGARRAMHSPLHFIRYNLSNGQLVREFAIDQSVTLDDLLERGGFNIFDGEQIVVTLQNRPTANLMHRGNDLVDMAEISPRKLRRARRLATEWLKTAVTSQTHTVSLYDPALRRAQRTATHAEQWQTTTTLLHSTRYTADPGLWSLTEELVEGLLRDRSAPLSADALEALSSFHRPDIVNALATNAATSPQDLANDIFQQADQLLGEQYWWPGADYPDFMGGFFADTHQSEMPNSEATARAVETLSAALISAREAGDSTRADLYRTALLRGLRALLQMQYNDAAELFFVPAELHPMTMGGFRTTVYDGRINVRAVNAAITALSAALNALQAEDYQTVTLPAA